jgi:hypothetical protein
MTARNIGEGEGVLPNQVMTARNIGEGEGVLPN